MSLFSKAQTWLPAALQNAAGVDVTVSLNGQSASVTAVIGRTVYAVNRADGARVEFGERDFLITASDLVAANAAWTTPSEGMRFEVDGEDSVYECRPPNTGEPAFRYSDPQRETWRIHAVEVE